jgi:hypothetical protein
MAKASPQTGWTTRRSTRHMVALALAGAVYRMRREAAMFRRLCVRIGSSAVLLVASCALTSITAQTRPSDWPQWRGSNRDGVVSGWVEPKSWPDTLTKKWKVEVGLGYATPLLVGDRLYVFTRQNTDEVMQALDAATGKQLWEARYAAPFKMSPAANRHGDGPKSTPTFNAGRLYSLGMAAWSPPMTPRAENACGRRRLLHLVRSTEPRCRRSSIAVW